MLPRMAVGLGLVLMLTSAGCCPFSITAISEAELCRGKCCPQPEGIPFYLPKPLLIISQNFQYIEESTVGLTQPVPIPNSFDRQSDYASLTAQASISTTSSVPGGTPGALMEAKDSCCPTQVLHSAGGPPVAPDPAKIALSTSKPFFTYQIVFVPDLTQKHYLRLKGGPGEVRATLNMVNGWMFTGIGPFYMKDSSTAQNILATGVLAKFGGSGASDVISSVANLSKNVNAGPASPPKLQMAMDAINKAALGERVFIPKADQTIKAEIHVYEPFVTPDGGTAWREITENLKSFSAVQLGLDKMENVGRPAVKIADNVQLDMLMKAAEADIQDHQLRAATVPPAVQGAFDPTVDKAFLDNQTPPQPRRRILDCLFPRQTTTNNVIEGPTTTK